MLPASVLALPQLAPEIPLHYSIAGVDALAVPLTIALLEAGLISNAMLRAPRNALLTEVFVDQEQQLAARALSRWWTNLIRAQPCKFFRWSLHVQQMDDTSYDKATTAWFCLSRINGHEDQVPRFALGRGIERLEALKAGFGQTVLAVLRDATFLLPESFNPWFALDWADRSYWRESEDDAELLEIRRVEGNYKTVDELLENEQVTTRAMFYAELPEWVCMPSRILPRDEIEAAATSDFARRAIKLCDDLSALVTYPDFVLRPYHKGVHSCGEYPIDGCMVLLWKQYDVIGQTIDDYLEEIGNCGEYTELIDANPVPMTAAGVAEFITTTKQMIDVAVLVEQLLLLLGEKF